METTRTSAKNAAFTLVICLLATSTANLYAEGPLALTSTASAATHDINQSVERLELLVKSSRILTLQARIPKFQVHNEEILGATPVSQNQIQVFAKTPGSTQLNLWDTNDKLYTCLLYTSPSPRDQRGSRMPSSA